jgi:hypothetical protein
LAQFRRCRLIVVELAAYLLPRDPDHSFGSFLLLFVVTRCFIFARLNHPVKEVLLKRSVEIIARLTMSATHQTPLEE